MCPRGREINIKCTSQSLSQRLDAPLWRDMNWVAAAAAPPPYINFPWSHLCNTSFYPLRHSSLYCFTRHNPHFTQGLFSRPCSASLARRVCSLRCVYVRMQYQANPITQVIKLAPQNNLFIYTHSIHRFRLRAILASLKLRRKIFVNMRAAH